jgi:hypothetical protein
MLMIAVSEQKKLRTEPQELNEVEASIAAIEKALFGSQERNRETIHELGCKIVAHALKMKWRGVADGSCKSTIMIQLAARWLRKECTHKSEMLAAYLLLMMIYCCIGMVQ